MNIYVCYHKAPIYEENEFICPIHVGKSLSKINLNIQSDNTGENISYKNPFYCELTATYWIWKNNTTDIVGLFHYRRYLNLKNNENRFYELSNDLWNKYGLTNDNISSLLKNYDIILPKKVKLDQSCYNHYASAHNVEDIDNTLNIIKNKYPDIYPKAEYILKHEMYIYPANMLICRKQLFDQYASWIFSILFELEKEIQSEVIKRDVYQQRVYGFLAERLMAIFIAINPELKVKEVSLLFRLEDIKEYKKYKRKQMKRWILSLLGLGKKRWKE